MSKDYNDGQKVETMVALGLTHEQIGYVLGCTAKTLRKYYTKELANGKAKVDALIGGQLVKKALGGNMTAIIFYLKTKCGWREQSDYGSEELPRLKIVFDQSNDE
jgi:hypothetical protein